MSQQDDADEIIRRSQELQAIIQKHLADGGKIGDQAIMSVNLEFLTVADKLAKIAYGVGFIQSKTDPSLPTPKAPTGERLGHSDGLGVAFTVEDLIHRLQALDPKTPIYCSQNNYRGIALHLHAFVDPTKDYLSFTRLEIPSLDPE
jgi:hypothetical protein